MSVIMRNDIEVGGTDDGIIAKVGTDTLDTTAQDLSGAVNELKGDMDSALKIVTYTTSVTITAGSNLAVNGSEFNISIPSGYTPMGIIQVNTNHNSVNVGRFRFAISGLVLSLHNFYSSDLTTNIDITVLYAKTNLVS